MEKNKIKYVEPADYFPKHLRKKHKLGEYAETAKSSNSKSTTENVTQNSQDE